MRNLFLILLMLSCTFCYASECDLKNLYSAESDNKILKTKKSFFHNEKKNGEEANSSNVNESFVIFPVKKDNASVYIWKH